MSSQILEILVRGTNQSKQAFDEVKKQTEGVTAAQKQMSEAAAIGKRMAEQYGDALQDQALVERLVAEEAKKLADALEEANGASKRFSKESIAAWQSAGQAAQKAGTALTAMVTVPLVGGALAAAKAAISYESAFAGVRKTVEATEPEFQKMSQGFRDLAKTIPVSAVELAKIGESAGQLGIGKDNVVAFTKVMAQLGVTTNMTSEEAATSLAQLANITRMSQGDFDRLGSTIVALGNAGASTEKDISAMALKLAGAGHQVGLSEAQILGLASSLANVGIKAEAGGSAFSRVLVDMQLAASKGGIALHNFATVAQMSAGEFATLFKKDAAAGLEAFINGLSKLKAAGGDVIGTLDAMGIKEIRERDAILRLAGASGELTKMLGISNAAWQANTALTKEAEERFKTTESQLKILWQRFVDVGITLGNALQPAIVSMSGALSDAIPMIESAAQWFKELDPAARNTGLALFGVAAAAGPALLAFAKLIEVALSLQKAWAALAATELVTSLGGVTAAAGYAAGALAALAVQVGVAVAGFAGAYVITDWFLELVGTRDALNELMDDLAGLSALERQVAADNKTNHLLDASRLQEMAGMRADYRKQREEEAKDYSIFSEEEWKALGREAEAIKKKAAAAKDAGITDAAALKAKEKQAAALKKLEDERLRELQHSQAQLKKDGDEFTKSLEAENARRMASDKEYTAWILFNGKERIDEEKMIADLIVKAAKSVTEGQKGEQKKQKKDLKDHLDSLQGFADAISTIAQTIGGAIGQALDVGVSMFGNAVSRMRDHVATLGEAAQTAADAFSGGYSMGRGLKSPGKGALAGAAAGAVTGAMVGSILPGVGTVAGGVIGGVIGGVGGWLGGKKGQEEARRAMEEMRKNLVRTFGDMQHLREEANKFGVDISRVFSTDDPEEFQRIVESLDEAMAAQARKLAAVKLAVSSVGGLTGHLDDDGKLVGGINLTRSPNAVQTAMAGLGQANPIGSAMAGLSISGTEQNARDQGTIFSAIFWASVKEQGLLASVDAMAGPFAALKEKISTALGPEAAETILGPMGQLFDTIQNNEGARGALEGVDALKAGLSGLADSGYLTTEAFGAIQRQGVAAFQQMTDAGVPVNTALQAMAPLIQEAITESEKFGIPLDANMQHMKEMAEASGIAFQSDPMERVASLLEAIAIHMGAIPEKMAAAGDSMATSLPAGAAAGAEGVDAALDSIGGSAERGASATTDAVAEMFMGMADQAEDGASDVGGFIDRLNLLEVNIPVTFHRTNNPPVPGTYGYNEDGTPDNDNDKTNSLGTGGWVPYRPGGTPVIFAERSNMGGGEWALPNDMVPRLAREIARHGGAGGKAPNITVQLVVGAEKFEGVQARRRRGGFHAAIR